MRLFIFCADPREEADLKKKIKKSLTRPGEKKIACLSLFGLPLPLAYPKEMEDEERALMRQIRFHLKAFGGDNKEIVLVWHRCGHYNEIKVRADGLKMLEDAKRGTAYLRRRLPGVNVMSYFDRSQGEDICFEEISPLPPSKAKEATTPQVPEMATS